MYSSNEIFGPNVLSTYGESFIDVLKEKIANGHCFKELQSNEDLEFFFYKKILQICENTEKNFSGIERLTGEYKEYHSHLYEVAILYINHAGVNATLKGLIIALRHDDIEDLHKDSNSKIKVNYSQIVHEDGTLVATGVQILSKPKVPHIDETRKIIGNDSLKTVRELQKSDRDYLYYSDFKDLESVINLLRNTLSNNGVQIIERELHLLARDISIIRIVDRIHNLKTMPENGYNNEKRLRKLINTEEFLLPLAKSLNIPELYSDLVSAIVQGYATYFKVKNSA